jgi:HEAT repeat protein
MTEQLSSFRIKRGRRVFDTYSAVNSFSFALVTGNAITLYALALGASSTVVGLLGSFLYASFFAIPLGKLALRRMTLVKTFANTWMIRTLSLVPLLFIPYFVAIGAGKTAILALLVGVFLFNLFRGMGLIANNPVIGILSPGKDRGEYIIRLSLINNAFSMLSTIVLALLLWRDSGVRTWNLVIVAGIAAGFVASLLLYRLPDPGARKGSSGNSSPSFFRIIAEALRETNFSRFILSYLVIGIGIGMARPFIVVYCKEVYGQSDSIVTVFSVASSIGAILMGLVMRLVIDRLGAKPMYVIFAAVSLASLVPALVSPGIGSAVFPVVFLCAFAAVTNMGFAGQESAAQTYFFAMVPKDAIMDLSMLYYFILGGTGALGSIAGGAMLDLLSAAGFSPLVSYRVFFIAAALIIALGIQLQKRLQDLGSYPVRDTLAVLFSPRDMRALTLLRKLDTNEDPDEETGIIAELGEVASSVSADELLSRLSSPRFAVRYEALQSVASLERLGSRLKDALLSELKTGEFGTAALAARFLGKFGVSQAIPALKAALSSADYRLAGEAMLALARLDDEKSQYAVRDLLLSTSNPFLLVRGVQAMTEYGTAASVPILVDLLRNEALPPHVADETILSLSDLMGVPKKFYYAYGDFVREKGRAREILVDIIDEYATRFHKDAGDLTGVVSAFIADSAADSRFVRWFLDSGKGHNGVFSALLVSVALDSGLNRQEPFRFFLCFWAIATFAFPDLIEK